VSKILVTAAATALATASASAQSLQPRIAVHLKSGGMIAGDEMLEAEFRVTRIFAAVGVSIRWINDVARGRVSNSDGALDITVTVLSTNAMASLFPDTPISSHALGLTVVNTTRAYLFGERIHEVARSHRNLPVVFGRVLAHEIGHIVLPTVAHSETGIMRADLSKAVSIFDPGFTTSQGQAIRHWLISGRMLDAAGNGRSRFGALATD